MKQDGAEKLNFMRSLQSEWPGAQETADDSDGSLLDIAVMVRLVAVIEGLGCQFQLLHSLRVLAARDICVISKQVRGSRE